MSKAKTNHKYLNIVRVSNYLMQPNPWLLKEQSETIDGVEVREYEFTYGQNGQTMHVYGKLYERDFGVWLGRIY